MSMPSPAELQYEMLHVTDNRGPELTAALAVNFALAGVALVLRLVSRYISRSSLKADDHTCIAAFVIVIGQLVVNLVGVNLGAGKHVILLKKPVEFAKIVLTSEVLYVTGTALVKFSFLFLYNRLFGNNRRFRQMLWACGIFVFLYSLVEILVLIFQCRPVRKAWDLSAEGTCVNLALGAVIVGCVNVVVDFVVLLLPVRMVSTLKLKKKWKLQLCGIFLLGGFVCVGSIVRVTTLHKLTFVDATWNDVDSAIWAMVENCIGIVSACLPTLRPLFNVIARGHHCSSGYGSCEKCSKGASSGDSSNHSEGNKVKIPSAVAWAGQPQAVGGRGSKMQQPASAFASLQSPAPPKEEHGYGGAQSSDEESLKLPKTNAQIF